MRKLNYAIVMLLVALTLTYALPLNKQALGAGETSIPNDCIAAGQPSITDSLGGANVDCHHIYYEGNLGFSFIQTWDPSWDYETYAGSLLGGIIYDMPVGYSGATAGVAGLGASSAITSIADNGAGTITFTIRSGVHGYSIDNSGNLVDNGALTTADWAYSFTRALAACNSQGPASAVYIWIAGANDWLNTCTGLDPNDQSNRTALATGWNTFTALNSISSTATTFTIKTSGDLSPVVSAYTPFLGILANSWAVGYSQTLVTAACGAINAGTGPNYTNQANLGEQCHNKHPGSWGGASDQYFDGNGHGQPVTIGSGPYILDQKLTNIASGVIYLRHNDNFCTQHGGAGTCDKIGTIAGPVDDVNRPTYIVITQVTSETGRANAMNVGTYDHSILAATSYPTFLQGSGPSSPPPYNDLLSGQVGKFNFHIIPSLVIQELQMIVHCGAANGCSNSSRGTFAEYPLAAVSPLLGDCPSSPGCHVRTAIQYAFDYGTYLSAISLGLGTLLANVIPDGLPSGNTCAQGNSAGCTALGGDLNTGPYSVSLPTHSTTQAVVQLLAGGYNHGNLLPHIECIYNNGNDARARACILLANSMEGLRSCNNLVTCGNSTSNPRYDPTCHVADSLHSGSCTIITGVGVQTPASSYLSGHVYKGLYDIAGTGWFPDYVDEDDYARPFFYGSGTFQINGMGFNNTAVNNDINAAAVLPAGHPRNQAYFKIQNETNALCHCYMYLQQPSGRSIWNAVIDQKVFTRLVNPAFLPYYSDIQKNPYVPSATPVFGSLIGAVILTALVTLSALVLFRRTTTRKLATGNLG